MRISFVLTIFPCIFLALALFPASVALGKGFDLGISIEGVDRTDEEGVDIGLGFLMGYEMKDTEHWSFGAELHYFNGATATDEVEFEGDLAFNSFSIFATARPTWFPLLLKAGPVYADYAIPEKRVKAVGVAVGAGLVFGGEWWRIHVFDFQHYEIRGQSFNSYAVTFGIFAEY